MCRTPCLEALLFTFVFIFPNAFTLFLRGIPLPWQGRVVREYVPLAITYGALVLLGAYGGFLLPLPWAVGWWWLPIGGLVGVAIVALEYLVAAAPRVSRGSGWPRLAPTSLYVGRRSLPAVLLIAVVAALEEMVHRHLLIGGTLALLVPAWVAVLISAAAYALNHGFFGRAAVLQKLPTGVLLGMLYLISGGIIAPIVAHLTQNLLLYGYATRAAQTQRPVARAVAR